MVNKITHNCILACNNRSCVNTSTETFKKIICPYHLSAVFGLKVAVQRFDSESETHLIGPYLMVDDNFHFDDKTVIFPVRTFIDSSVGISNTSGQEDFSYSLNPRMKTYLNNLVQEQCQLTDQERRYQIEIIRNLFLTDKQIVELIPNTKTSNMELHNTVTSRITNLNLLIENENYAKLFDAIEIVNTTTNTADNSTSKTFSPFMKFILLNCVSDEHALPVAHNGLGITTYANILYKDTFGFISTLGIINPQYLIFAGKTTGKNGFYQNKVTTLSKQMSNTKINIKDLADNRQISNVINHPMDFCNNFI